MKNRTLGYGWRRIQGCLLACFFALLTLGFGQQSSAAETGGEGYVDLSGGVFDLQGGTYQSLYVDSDLASSDSAMTPKVLKIIDSVGGGYIDSFRIGGTGDHVTLESGKIGTFFLDGEGSQVTVHSGTVYQIDLFSASAKAVINGGTVNAVRGKGQATMNTGRIIGYESPQAKCVSAVDCKTFVMNGGTIAVPSGRGIAVSAGANITITGGTIDAKLAIGSVENVTKEYGTYVADVTLCNDEYAGKPAYLAIQGGTVRGGTPEGDKNAPVSIMEGAALELGGLTGVSITGGNIQGPVKLHHCKNVTIDHAVFTNPLWIGAHTSGTNEAVTIQGGTFQDGIWVLDASTVTIRNASCQAGKHGKLGLDVRDNGANVTVESGTFSGRASTAVTVDEGSSLTVKGGSFKGNLSCRGVLKLSGGTFTPAGSAKDVSIVYGEKDILSALAPGYCYEEAEGDRHLNYIHTGHVSASRRLTIVAGKQKWLVGYVSYYNNGTGNRLIPVFLKETKELSSGASYGTLPVPTRKGYTFEGWYRDGKKITSSSTFSWKPGDSCNMEGNDQYAVYLEGRWSKDAGPTGSAYTVSFDANGGKKVTADKKLKIGERYGTLPKATRKGYKFLGWYTKKTSGTKVSASTTLKKAKNVTVYAHWKRATYKLTFKLQGGKLSGSYKKSYNIATKTFQLPKPKRSGYTFRGWSTSAKKFKLVTKIKKGTAGNKTLYAWWTKKASSTPKLSATSKSLTVGQGVTLKVTGTKKKVTWKSTNKKVATVKNGKVTAKKEGTAKITATVAGKKLTCTITVKAKKSTVYKAPAAGTWYQVGEDIPAGEYVFKSSNPGAGFVSVCRPGGEEAPIYYELVYDNLILTLSKGMLVSYEECAAIPIAESLGKITTKIEGTYKVGFHIPAGVYTLKVTSMIGDEGDYTIYKSSRPEAEYTKKKSFKGTVQVRVREGEYLKLGLCKIEQ